MQFLFSVLISILNISAATTEATTTTSQGKMNFIYCLTALNDTFSVIKITNKIEKIVPALAKTTSEMIKIDSKLEILI